MAETGRKWYVMRAVSGKEAKLKEYIEAELKHNQALADRVSEVMIPMERHAATRNGKRVEKEKIALPGYVFVQADMTPDVASTLRFMPNCLGFLGGMDHPSAVPQAEINKMVGNAESTEIENEVTVPFVYDETVKVTDGPFSGFEGIVEDIYPDKRKLKVNVKIFGRKTPLELGFMQVEKVAE